MKILTPQDEAILAAFDNVVTAIANTFGDHTEVVLHSLDLRNPSIIKIVNGHITGRDVGAPITNFVLNKLAAKENLSVPYFNKSPKGRNLRSTTTIIRNPQGEAIGTLCVNVDLDAPFQEVIRPFVLPALSNSEETKSIEIFTNSSEEMLKTTIENAYQEITLDKTISAGKKARTLVHRLDCLGVFNFKNSQQLVAEVTGISIHTIYRHLRER
ncbi:hypothetical protein A6A19_04640 [Actinobacillus delphinicola]|uniref:helix-turn-helix transcriptional regulator n=1 Tax=Actinobacillus delphinicola TaxID=51161 RepID=UPI002442A69C|nr:PAS domain-containing protein [Actinobacillus delphinicola]MDG6897298.1 hypothetical protein [Actinobacillus delphinicola]